MFAFLRAFVNENSKWSIDFNKRSLSSKRSEKRVVLGRDISANCFLRKARKWFQSKFGFLSDFFSSAAI